MFYPPTGMVRDLLPLPDEAALLIPALVDSLGSFPPDEQIGRARAALILLARESGLWGASDLSGTCTSLGEIVTWCLRILLTMHSNQQSASRAWAELMDRTKNLDDFPAASPPRTHERQRQDDPRPRSPSPAQPTNVTINDMAGLLRALSSSSRTTESPSLEALVSEIRRERRRTEEVVVGTATYVVARDDPMAPRLLAALASLRRRLTDITAERLPPRPLSVSAIAALHLMPQVQGQLWLAEEWVGQEEGADLLDGLRLARVAPPESAFEAQAWRSGTLLPTTVPAVANTRRRNHLQGRVQQRSSDNNNNNNNNNNKHRNPKN